MRTFALQMLASWSVDICCRSCFSWKATKRKRWPWYEKLCFTERNRTWRASHFVNTGVPSFEISHSSRTCFLPSSSKSGSPSLHIENWIEDYNSTKTGQERRRKDRCSRLKLSLIRISSFHAWFWFTCIWKKVQGGESEGNGPVFWRGSKKWRPVMKCYGGARHAALSSSDAMHASACVAAWPGPSPTCEYTAIDIRLPVNCRRRGALGTEDCFAPTVIFHASGGRLATAFETT